MMQNKNQENGYSGNVEAMLDHLYKAYILAKEMNLQPLTLHCFDFLANALKDEKLGSKVFSSNQP